MSNSDSLFDSSNDPHADLTAERLSSLFANEFPFSSEFFTVELSLHHGRQVIAEVQAPNTIEVTEKLRDLGFESFHIQMALELTLPNLAFLTAPHTDPSNADTFVETKLIEVQQQFEEWYNDSDAPLWTLELVHELGLRVRVVVVAPDAVQVRRYFSAQQEFELVDLKPLKLG